MTVLRYDPQTREIPTEGASSDAIPTSVLCQMISPVSWRATGIPVQSLLKGERQRLSYLVDRSRIVGARRQERPRRWCDQQRDARIARWLAGAHATRGTVLVPGPDGNRQDRIVQGTGWVFVRRRAPDTD